MGLDIDGYNLCSLIYADDIVLFSDTPEKLQLLLDKVQDWCNIWQLDINYDKSKVIHCRNKNQNVTNYAFTIGNHKLDIVSNYKYLGIILNEFMTFNSNVEILTESGGRALGALITKSKSVKNMGHAMFSKLYHSCVIPILDYCSGAWGYHSTDKVNNIQNRAIRSFLGST